MELLFFERDRFNLLYNCTFYDPDTVPAEDRGMPMVGALCLPCGLLSITLYIFCIYAIYEKGLLKHSTYRLMLLMAFYHLYGIVLGGFFMTYLLCYGPVFCDNPTFIYFAGTFGTSGWMGSTVAGTILSFNRCCEMYSSHLARSLFSGKKVYLWMIAPCSLFLYCVMFEKPLLFNGIGNSWFFNPHYGYFDDEGKVYVNYIHTLNNTLTVFTQITLSSTFVLLYFLRVKRHESTMSRNDKLMCLQVFIIGLFELVASLSFLIENWFSTGLAISLIAGGSYLGANACAPYVYLIFNRSIRNVLIKRLILLHNSRVYTTNERYFLNSQSASK
ncbi:unnamed protein product [Bursaphelenchus xylophilus]|uniref:(pine wood nematode) hypothetical protein n=1 Tax=Bursaphelenchus xylophilus TaxID=6326 RepID=A0A7I8WZI0_BURXY|nr:unnamed protein product [Bursaphelenchus xylophilus]CAG9129397.1 unnamed protein product [Bursaphelenchus xylophilus]